MARDLLQMISRFLFISLVAAVAMQTPVVGRAQSTTSTAPPTCSADSAFHVLDFWVGEWRVVDSAGIEVGRNRIERILDGCAVTETWRDTGNNEGRSLFYYVPSQKQWKQVWVTPQALIPGGLKEKHLIGRTTDGGVRFQGEIVGPRGLILDRTTLSPQPGGRVRQLIEISRDAGTTWRTSFDAIYIPVLPSSRN
jgi:hypothetical protein